MGSQVHKRGAIAPAMNITPLIDVVFLLIIFFMLVGSIASNDAAPMIVPTLDQPRTMPMEEAQRVVVNIVPQDFDDKVRLAGNPLVFDGMAKEVRMGQFVVPMGNLAQLTDLLRSERARNPEIEVVLRADAAIYYDEVQPVMAAITGAGIETVKMVAYMPEVSAPVVDE